MVHFTNSVMCFNSSVMQKLNFLLNKKPYLLVKNENVNINTNDQNFENIAPNKISELQCFNDKQGKENNQIYAYKVDDINEI